MEPSPTGAIFALKNFGWTDKRIPENMDKEKAEKLVEALGV